MSIRFDDSDFQKKSGNFVNKINDAVWHGISDVANEILRLSTFEVPHDTGALQTSGGVEAQPDHSQIVGYNKVYAARLHEHPKYHFQKGRKGKYLEDPIKNNYRVLIKYIQDAMKTAMAI